MSKLLRTSMEKREVGVGEVVVAEGEDGEEEPFFTGLSGLLITTDFGGGEAGGVEGAEGGEKDSTGEEGAEAMFWGAAFWGLDGLLDFPLSLRDVTVSHSSVIVESASKKIESLLALLLRLCWRLWLRLLLQLL